MASRTPLPDSVTTKFEIFDWRNALPLLAAVHPGEFADVLAVLEGFQLRWSLVAEKGRNKTEPAKALDSAFYGRGWEEKSFDTRIVVDGVESPTPTHSVDCFKGRVALEVEWNNKDPFFDRDLNNFRLLYELRVIDLGVVITRTTGLQKWLHQNSQMFERKTTAFGTSTTHLDKLIPRIVGGGAGGCPVAVFAIKQEAFVDDR